MVWEAHGALGGALPNTTYPQALADWKALVRGVASVGRQLAARDNSTSLAPPGYATGFLAARVNDSVVADLCAKVRKQFHMQTNVTDLWGAVLCDYYQEVGWGTPENGVAFFSFAKGLLGMRATADGTLALAGTASPVVRAGMQPWRVDARPLPEGWPQEVSAVSVLGMAVNGVSVNVTCMAFAAAAEGAVGGAGGAGTLSCTLAPVPTADNDAGPVVQKRSV